MAHARAPETSAQQPRARRFDRGAALHAAVLALFALAFGLGLFAEGPAAWLAGVLYAGYDTALLAFVGLQVRALLRAPAAPVAPERPLTLGVVIAARNEAAALPRTIDALLAQTRPPDWIVIADDGSSDDTPQTLRLAYGLPPPAPGAAEQVQRAASRLIWLRLPAGGKARALNAAIAFAEADVVATVDADTLLQPGACAAMAAAFAQDPALAVGAGVLEPVCAPGRWAGVFRLFQRYEYLRSFFSRFGWARRDALLLVSGAFAGYRRGPLLELGGFDPESLVEDYEIMHRLHRVSHGEGRGWRVRVIGAARGVTEAPHALPAFLRQRRRWFAGFLGTQARNRDMVGDRRYGALGRLMLPVKAVDTVQPLFGLTAFGLLLSFAALRKWDLLLIAACIIAAKLVIDVLFLLYQLHAYAKLTGDRPPLGPGLLAICLEPFSFQLLRHLGAAWGWWFFLHGRKRWDASRAITRVTIA